MYIFPIINRFAQLLWKSNTGDNDNPFFTLFPFSLKDFQKVSQLQVTECHSQPSTPWCETVFQARHFFHLNFWVSATKPPRSRSSPKPPFLPRAYSGLRSCAPSGLPLDSVWPLLPRGMRLPWWRVRTPSPWAGNERKTRILLHLDNSRIPEYAFPRKQEASARPGFNSFPDSWSTREWLWGRPLKAVQEHGLTEAHRVDQWKYLIKVDSKQSRLAG